jgi:hypothetical protein
MEYLVEFEIKVPDGIPASEVEDRRKMRPWRPPGWWKKDISSRTAWRAAAR